MSRFPQIVNIELTNKCNLSCRFCDHLALRAKMNIQDIDDSLLEKILDDIPSEGVFELGIVGLGEPLLNNRLREHLVLIKSFASKFQRISMNSNAVALDSDKITILLKSPINFITFSLNAATQNSYKYLTGSENFTNTVKNINNFLDARASLYPTLDVRIQIMDTCANEEEAVHSLFSRHLSDKVQIFVRKLYSKPATEGMLGDLPKDQNRHPCWSIYSRIYIDVNGNVYPCTIGNDCYRSPSNLTIGSIQKDSLRQIFNDNPIAKARNSAESGSLPFPECEKCNIWSLLPNNFEWNGKRWTKKDSQLRTSIYKN